MRRSADAQGVQQPLLAVPTHERAPDAQKQPHRPVKRHLARDWWVGRGPSPCERHSGLCAHTGQEPHRCPRCHRAWRAIVDCECAGCRGNHRRWHDERDKATEETRARMRAVRALRGSAADER